jgi:hypothetical protein
MVWGSGVRVWGLWSGVSGLGLRAFIFFSVVFDTLAASEPHHG